MKTIHGYDDTEKVLTREQWDNATTEQRSGFLELGYTIFEGPKTFDTLADMADAYERILRAKHKQP